MIAESRPDPDRLLAKIQEDEARAKRGRLRIFFGSSAGVGKTYGMLEAARNVKASGVDVVVGYVEPHGRVETECLLEGLERLPSLPVSYRGIVRQEFDLDAALTRHPSIVLVDELAHSNLVGGEPAPRHPKRWQDVEELLDAGINVWTTLNVQHLESLNDLIFQITGVRQRETLPDRIFDEADDIELIDLPPDDLLARVRAALRRGVRAAEKVAELTIGATQIDFARRLTHGPSGEVHLTPLEFRALECLARHLGSVVTQSQLIREVWGPQRVADTRSLRVCIKHLREKLEPDPGKPQYLLTETGVGSRLRGEENPELTSARER